MNRDNERLAIHPGPNGKGEQVVPVSPKALHTTAIAWKVHDSLCCRCRTPIGYDVYITVNDKHLHLRCVCV